MKKIIFASALSLAAVITANAGTTKSALKVNSLQADSTSLLQSDSSFILQSDSTFSLQKDSSSSLLQDKTPVKAQDLPDSIKTKLADDHFKEWTLTTAFLVGGTTPYYELTLTKGTETKTIKLDKDGKKVD